MEWLQGIFGKKTVVESFNFAWDFWEDALEKIAGERKDPKYAGVKKRLEAIIEGRPDIWPLLVNAFIFESNFLIEEIANLKDEDVPAFIKYFDAKDNVLHIGQWAADTGMDVPDLFLNTITPSEINSALGIRNALEKSGIPFSKMHALASGGIMRIVQRRLRLGEERMRDTVKEPGMYIATKDRTWSSRFVKNFFFYPAKFPLKADLPKEDRIALRETMGLGPRFTFYGCVFGPEGIL